MGRFTPASRSFEERRIGVVVSQAGVAARLTLRTFLSLAMGFLTAVRTQGSVRPEKLPQMPIFMPQSAKGIFQQ
jgi:hypothetical protein